MTRLLDSLQIAFGQPGYPFIFAVEFIVLLWAITIKQISRRGLILVLICGWMWWSALAFIYPPQGFTYDIYTYNADLTLAGKTAYGRDASTDPPNAPIPSYLDYTGAQHGIYVFLRSLDLSSWHPHLRGFGYQLWSAINIGLIFLILFFRDTPGYKNRVTQKMWPALVLAFHPIYALLWIYPTWLDKFSFLLIPLLTIFLLEKNKSHLASFLTGFSIALNGLLFLLAPAIVLDEIRHRGWRAIWSFMLIIIGGLLTMIPYFPESLIGWSNRATRLNIARPFWFSIYKPLPEGIYTTQINQLLIVVISLLLIISFWLGWINKRDIIIGSLCIVLILSPFNTADRIIPLILLIAILTSHLTRRYWLMIILALSLTFGVIFGYGPLDAELIHIIVFYLPLLLVLIFYIYRRLQTNRMFHPSYRA